MSRLSAAIEAYASYRNAVVSYEGHDISDGGILDQLLEDLGKAEREMELAFIEHKTGAAS